MGTFGLATHDVRTATESLKAKNSTKLDGIELNQSNGEWSWNSIQAEFVAAISLIFFAVVFAIENFVCDVQIYFINGYNKYLA